MAIALSIVIPSRGDDVHRALATSRALMGQQLPGGVRRQVTIVLDGTSDSIEAVPLGVSAELQILKLPIVRGRAGARNAGAAASRGNVLLFVDADCLPIGPDFLIQLLAAFSDPHVVAAGGRVRGSGNGFWSRYQADTGRRRETSASVAGPPLTAANLAIRKEAFERCQGFDEAYRHYGFEDRDLLLRLTNLGSVVSVPRVCVSHEDTLSLNAVSRKLCEAGATTASRFASSHANAYRALGYAAIDARLHPWLRIPAQIFGPPAMQAATTIEPLLHQPWMPYAVARTLVRCVSALAFLYGSTRTQSDNTRA